MSGGIWRKPALTSPLDRQAAGEYPRLVTWVEENIEETLSFYRLPRQHHKHLRAPTPELKKETLCKAA